MTEEGNMKSCGVGFAKAERSLHHRVMQPTAGDGTFRVGGDETSSPHVPYLIK